MGTSWEVDTTPEPDDDYAICCYCHYGIDRDDPMVLVGGSAVNGWIVAHEECTGTCECGEHYSLLEPPRLRGSWVVCATCYAAQAGERKD